MSKTFQSLGNRNWLTSIALTLLVLRLTGSGIAVGWLAACQYGPILLLSPWGGAFADRSDKRLLLFVTQGLEMAQSIGLAILAFQPHPSWIALYTPVSYTHLRAHETGRNLVCRLLLEKKKKKKKK